MEELNTKLMKIQTELKAPKDAWNDFSKYSYRSAESILEALKPLLKDNKLTLVLSDDIVCIGTWNYVKATATLSDGKNSISATASAREEESLKGQISAQITGGASSYSRKYALNGLFAIDDTKDADSQDNRTQAPKKAVQPKPDPLAAAKSNLQKALEEAGHDNPVKMKAAISLILKKSTVDNVDEANDVLQALEDGIL